MKLLAILMSVILTLIGLANLVLTMQLKTELRELHEVEVMVLHTESPPEVLPSLDTVF